MEQLVQNPGFTYVVLNIFAYLDNKTLKNCRLVCKSWCNFIDLEKINWIEILDRQTAELTDWLDQNPSWSNAIIEICDGGQIEVIKKMFVALNQSKYLIYEKSPLQQAALVGDIETIEFLVPLLRENDDDHQNLFILAATKGHLDIVKYLINQGFDVNEQNEDHETPLHRAASYGDLAVFKVIWTLAIDKNPKDKNGLTPLHISSQNGHRLIVKFITSRISDADPKSNDGTSILHSAAASGNKI